MRRILFLLCAAFMLLGNMTAQKDVAAFRTWAMTPPMGWNSWDCYYSSVTEKEVMQNAQYLVDNDLVKLPNGVWTSWRWMIWVVRSILTRSTWFVRLSTKQDARWCCLWVLVRRSTNTRRNVWKMPICSLHVNKNVEGGTLKVEGQSYHS